MVKAAQLPTLWDYNKKQREKVAMLETIIRQVRNHGLIRNP